MKEQRKAQGKIEWSVNHQLTKRGYLTAENEQNRRAGRIPYRERAIHSSAMASGCHPGFTVCKHKSIHLRFSKSTDAAVEKAYSTHYVNMA
ncbi:MAG: hypothetical protein IKD69_16055 [Solobacterium sp.]|nr:hypothetical protein [Solobacterium sp.]